MTQRVNMLSRPTGLSPGIPMEKEGTDSHKLSSGLYVMLCMSTLRACSRRHTHHTQEQKLAQDEAIQWSNMDGDEFMNSPLPAQELLAVNGFLEESQIL